MRRQKILLADDHPMVLEGVAKILEEHFDIVGKVEDGRALINAAKELKPDVVVLDISMPLLNGFEAARQLRKLIPDSKLIFLTMHADATYANEAFEAGASAYLLKRSAASELTKAIRTVTSGQMYLTPLLRPEDSPPLGNGSEKQVPKLKQLTPRQREILQLIGEGKSTKDIAAFLSISVKTVEFHKSNIMETLAIHTTAQLTRYAVAHGLAKL
ncbi:MAG: response regulator transcription factor [Nitrospirota bacterium]|nr:MAG: response regulator transcription factor [Nitrospirota bacterium]